jgi:selenocysteine lyase/cysteine desulfurase
MLTRRGVLGAATVAGAAVAAGGAAALAACEPDLQTSSPARSFDPTDWRSVRGQFGLDDGVAHLSAFVFASHPAPVRDAIDRHRRGFDADAVGYLHTQQEPAEEAVLKAAAAYLEARPEQLAFTDSTTMGLGLLYSGLALAPGDEILTTEHDFYATHEALRLRSVRDGAVVRRVRLYADAARAGVDGTVDAVLGALTPKTRVLALTWVHSSTGVRLPVRAIADAVRRRAGDRVLVCVDAVHGLGAVDATPASLGADFLVAGTHKWLFGPRGTGIVWGSDAAWARYTPVIPAFDARGMIGWLTGRPAAAAGGRSATPGGYHSFEHRWALAEAFAFQSALGRPRVAAQVTALATALKEGLGGIPGVTVHTPAAPDLSAGIVCCEVSGVPAREAVNALAAAKVIATVTPYATELLRFGTSIVTDETDVQRAITAVRALR